MSSDLCNLGDVLRITGALLAVVHLDHIDGCAHVGGELVDVDALGDPHRRIGVAERVRHALLSVVLEQQPALAHHPLEALLEGVDGFSVAVAEHDLG